MAKEKELKTNAMRLLDRQQITYAVHTYKCAEFNDGITMADMLLLPHEITYKTLVTIGKSKDYYIFVIPIEKEIDLKKAARVADEKAIAMVPVKEIHSITGYIRGGCTAIGMKKQYPTFVDKSCEILKRIVVSGGKLGVQLELNVEDYLTASKGKLADVCKDSE